MNSMIAELGKAEQLGPNTWKLTSGNKPAVVREVFGVDLPGVKKRLKDVRRCGSALVVAPDSVCEEDGRVFVRRPFLEGRVLEPVASLDDIESLLELVSSLPESFVLFDLRPEHLLATERGLVLLDPGWSQLGTSPYSSPEQNGRGEVTTSVNAYQVGATVLHLLRGEKPLDALTLLLPDVEPPLIEALPSSLASLINQLLEADPNARPSIKRVLRQLRSWRKSVSGGKKEGAEALPSITPADVDESMSSPNVAPSGVAYGSLKEALEDLGQKAEATKAISSRPRVNQMSLGMAGTLVGLVGIPLLLSVGVGMYGYNHGYFGDIEPQATKAAVQVYSGAPTANYLPPVWKSPKDGAEMVLIRPGSFFRGPRPEAGHGAEPVVDELPAFYIDRYEVTNRQFAKFVKETGYKTESRWKDYATEARMDHPVISVSWYDAQAYAAWAGKRLPKGDEWEKAARGADGRRYPWGNEPDTARLNSFESGHGNTTVQGTYHNGASPFGVEDMAGNVWEWVDAWYIPLGAASETLPMQRSARGGCRSDVIEDCTVTSERGVFPESGALVNAGFRCVYDPAPAKVGTTSAWPASAVVSTKARAAKLAKPKASPSPSPAPEEAMDYDPYAPSETDVYYDEHGYYPAYDYGAGQAPSGEGSFPEEYNENSGAAGVANGSGGAGAAESGARGRAATGAPGAYGASGASGGSSASSAGRPAVPGAGGKSSDGTLFPTAPAKGAPSVSRARGMDVPSARAGGGAQGGAVSRGRTGVSGVTTKVTAGGKSSDGTEFPAAPGH